MNRIETLANDLALLSNDSLRQLAKILVRDYPTRADRVEHMISVETQETLRALHKELGIEA